MEADLEPSVETEERLKAEAAEAQRRQAELDRIAADVVARRQAAELQQQQQAEERERLRQVVPHSELKGEVFEDRCDDCCSHTIRITK